MALKLCRGNNFIISPFHQREETNFFYPRMKIMNNYENEIFDNYINIRENFDTLLSFKKTIYYKNKYKQLFLELERTNCEIELINEYRDKLIKLNKNY